jgi:hypothetical protein
MDSNSNTTTKHIIFRNNESRIPARLYSATSKKERKKQPEPIDPILHRIEDQDLRFRLVKQKKVLTLLPVFSIICHYGT